MERLDAAHVGLQDTADNARLMGAVAGAAVGGPLGAAVGGDVGGMVRARRAR